MLYVFNTSVKEFVFRQYICVQVAVETNRPYYGLRVVVLCYHFAYSVYTLLIALSGVCTMHLAFCDFALVLFLAEIALYSTSHFKLSWSFILYPFCHCTLAFRRLLFVQVLLSTAILFRSSDNNAWRLKKKLSPLL